MGGIGSILRATGDNTVNVVSKVKNPALQGQIDASLGDITAMRTGQGAALDEYIQKYLAGTGAAERATGQETGAIGQFYNGQMAQQLSQLRAQREGAVNSAADIAVKQALRGVNSGQLGDQGSGSSYSQRLAIGATAPIRAQAALDNANQQRADLGYLTTNQINLAGQRTGLENSLAARGLVPSQARAAMYGSNLGLLQNVTNLDQANKFYGLKKPTNVGADIADAVGSDILNAASIYSSVGGAGAGAARGGQITGPGSDTSDSIDIRVSDGEYIVPAASLEIPGVRDLLEEIRKLGLRRQAAKDLVRRFAGGGMVLRRRGYWDGGEIPLGGGEGGAFGVDYSGTPGYDYGGNPGGEQPAPQQKQQQKSGGGGGGGLAGEAQYLLQRSGADLYPEWQGATIIPTQGGAPAMPGPRPISMPHAGYTPMHAEHDFMAGYLAETGRTWNPAPETWRDTRPAGQPAAPAMDSAAREEQLRQRQLAPDLNIPTDTMWS